jgi:ABC-type multidrug transport system fused ATPase/permease subunit
LNQSLISSIRQIWKHLSPRRHYQFGLLILLAIITSFFEIVSLGAVLPFISVITQPDEALKYEVVSYFAEMAGITSGDELVLPIAISFALAAIITALFRLLLLWGTLQLGNASGVDLGVDVYRKTLFQPYSAHLTKSTSEIISVITLKVGIVASVLLSLVTLTTSMFLFFAIIATLISVDPFIAFISAVSFSLIYVFIGVFSSKRLTSNSISIASEQNFIVKALQEGLGSIRDVLLDSNQMIYIKNYEQAATKLRHGNSQNAFINQFPRFILESLALVLISIFVLSLSSTKDGITQALPILAMVALGAQRLLPIVQQIYGNWSVIMGNKAALIDVLSLLNRELPEQVNMLSLKPMEFKESIEFKNVSFRYNKSSPWVFQDVNLTIPKGSTVGIIGSTGSGKSTFVDILMSLLSPSTGSIFIDRKELYSDLHQASWQSSLAHVPQSIYLTDASVAENIAFGVHGDKININRVHEAAKKAQISEFIENSPEGYDAVVGERGVRLSGGQRQRIGIARALYKKASVIIFDEATSALDDKTEDAVMKTIDGLGKELTMFIIAHRLTTLKNCTHIIELKDCKLNRIGTYKEILESN